MNILSQTLEIISQEFIPYVSQKHLHLFKFGLQALALTRFQSLNSNARIAVANRHTAESKIYRLARKEAILKSFFNILSHLNLVNQNSVVIIDFSTFCGFQVLTLALQTRFGRAIPLFFDIITYPIENPTSQNLFIVETIKKFREIIGFYPRFVLDRGFAIPSLIDFFMKNQIIFYVRSKSGKHVIVPGRGKNREKIVPLSQIRIYDSNISAYGYLLRLIISPKPQKDEEPWYIFTNDFDLKRKEIIDVYYYRFEIEETFKDLKYVSNLKQFFIKKKLTFKIVLWFFILTVWLAHFLDEKFKNFINKTKTNAHKELSRFRYWFEAIQRSFCFSFLNFSYRRHVF
jgi:Transposase DDE domain